ncbi:MAG TPA: CotH kinase family protein [Fibrobacteria bacterium]|nr:CotH kinase family protein [Fibrobacteria bacterium]
MNHVHLKIASLLAACAALSGCFDEAKLLGAPATPDTAGYLPAARADSLPVVFSEICPGNAALEDEFGDDPGWIEVTNRSSDSVDLKAYRIRGDSKDGSGWRLPDTTLPPGGSVLVFMSGRDKRTSEPASVATEARLTSAWSWSDSLNENPGPGFSAVRPDRFKRLTGKDPDGSIAISAKLLLMDNAEAGLEWSSASVGAGIQEIDASDLDRLLLRGTFPANQKLMLRLCFDSECWKHGAVPFFGTGVENDEYVLRIASFDVDPSRINGFQMDPPANALGTYSVHVNRVAFFRAARNFHSNFKLDRDGGRLGLEDTTGTAATEIDYPAIPPTGTWARDPSSGRWAFASSGTPGRANPSGALPDLLDSPVFLTAPGFHASPLTVKVSKLPGQSTRCETGGRSPTPTSPSADSGIRLDSTASVSCAAFAADGRRGPVRTATFLLDENIRLPVVSLTVDPDRMFDPDSGIHSLGPNASEEIPNFGANFWHDIELPANIELFDGGSHAFSLPAGVGIYGNWTRAQPKKAFSIQFREKYGVTQAEWPLFPHHPQFQKFKGFGLRANGSNASTDYVRDGMMQSFTESRGLEYQLSRHVVFFINGRYWGIYEIREKLDPDYFETRFGIDKSEIDLVKNNSEVQAGSSSDWNALRRTVEDLAPDDEAGWASVASRIDLDNHMDYVATELFANNDDWPANNVRCWRRNGSAASRWRMMLFDLDGGLGAFSGSYTKNLFPFVADSSLGWDEYPNGRGSNVFVRRIFGRKVLRDRFINRFLVQLATNLSPTTTLRAMDSIVGSISSEVPRDVARWKFSASKQTQQDGVIRTFLQKRPETIIGQMKNFFKLDSTTTLSLSATGGTIRIEDIAVGSGYSGPHYRGLPVVVEAVSSGGRAFLGWSDGTAIARRVLVPGTDPTTLVARFE